MPVFLPLVQNSKNGKSYFSSQHILSTKILDFCSIAKAHLLNEFFINVIFPTWGQSGILIKLKQKVTLLSFLCIPFSSQSQIKEGQAGCIYNG